jgi:hypothetical protein
VKQAPVPLRSTLKPILKRGCLVAAANWPVTLVQSTADSLFKLLLAVPLVGGVFLVALAVGAEPGSLFVLTWSEFLTTIVGSLLSHPVTLVMFLLSLGTMTVGGSLFVFLIKGGTIGVLVAGDRAAGPIEEPPLQFERVARAARFSVELFIDRAQTLFPRYAKLGLALMVVYLATGLMYFSVVVIGRPSGGSLVVAALFTIGIVGWITIVNVLYLLVQIVIAADDCGIRTAARRTLAFVRHERVMLGGVFGVVLAMVIVATGASFIAAASLSVITFVPFLGPFLGMAVLPLQLLAWMLREIVFQYIGLSSVGAYLKLYRDFSSRSEPAVARMTTPALVVDSH